MHLLDEAPVPMVVMVAEEAVEKEDVAPKAAWRSVAKIARSLSVTLNCRQWLERISASASRWASSCA